MTSIRGDQAIGTLRDHSNGLDHLDIISECPLLTCFKGNAGLKNGMLVLTSVARPPFFIVLSPIVAVAEAVPDVPPNRPILFNELVLGDWGHIASPVVKDSGARTGARQDVQNLSVLCGLGELIPCIWCFHGGICH